jgi:hypothetical protein
MIIKQANIKIIQRFWILLLKISDKAVVKALWAKTFQVFGKLRKQDRIPFPSKPIFFQGPISQKQTQGSTQKRNPVLII